MACNISLQIIVTFARFLKAYPIIMKPSATGTEKCIIDDMCSMEVPSYN